MNSKEDDSKFNIMCLSDVSNVDFLIDSEYSNQAA